ncbi:hypothetical protein HYH03_010186 [Edaphochlamys debaryana]|uniref:3'-5' exonuclease domain-containing protein n=1 Tax=Edaphochlamys debaryana TaxID=47281 RepID=A0A836BWE5_9CHLO|nr:hypothetical protein HYH03_010186 [Edaphochlamys debaryana]|eukprot:KAG2491395.1 hypothetical protein HYH03_010186 [Edaphochlamys debaryana]
MSIKQAIERLAGLLAGKTSVLSTKGGLAYGIAQLVDDVPTLERMVVALQSARQIALDAEGVSLGRAGKMCLLSLSPAAPAGSPPDTPTPVYLLDISTLSTVAFIHSPPSLQRAGSGGSGSRRAPGRAAGPGPPRPGTVDAAGNLPVPGTGDPGGPYSCLKDILECPKVAKLAFDVRCDAEALFHQHGVRLGGAVDLQLAEVAYRRYGPAPRRVAYVMGLSKVLESYLDAEARERWRATAVDKRLLHEQFNRDPQYWDRRPLTEEQVRYAADDVLYLHHLQRFFGETLPEPIMSRVVRFSEYRVLESCQSAAGAGPGAAPGLAGARLAGATGDASRAQAPAGL